MSNQDEDPDLLSEQPCCRGSCETCSTATSTQATTDEDGKEFQLPKELGPDLGGES